jgi:hypothetical protein
MMLNSGTWAVLFCSTIGSFAATGAWAPLSAQEEEPLLNLQFFPQDITRDSLVEVMRGFSLSLGVRCQYCHVGGNGVSFEGVEFESDDDPDKRKTRFMLRMVETLNQSMLPMMADRDEPAYEISCKTCHRGSAKPILLTEALRATLDAEGPEAAVAEYRSLRERAGMSGMFDFGEWEMNILGERLTDEGRYRDAIAVYGVNEEFFPNSLSIALRLGDLYMRIDDSEGAIRYFERALEIAPGNANAQARLNELRGLT